VKPAYVPRRDLTPRFLPLLAGPPRRCRQPIYVDTGAIKPLIGGAELMCPGIRKDLLVEFAADTPVQIMSEGKTLPFAVGITKMSSADIKNSNTGVGVEILHTLGDGLWNTISIS
jgi:PUA domain protein